MLNILNTWLLSLISCIMVLSLKGIKTMDFCPEKGLFIDSGRMERGYRIPARVSGWHTVQREHGEDLEHRGRHAVQMPAVFTEKGRRQVLYVVAYE